MIVPYQYAYMINLTLKLKDLVSLLPLSFGLPS